MLKAVSRVIVVTGFVCLSGLANATVIDFEGLAAPGASSSTSFFSQGIETTYFGFTWGPTGSATGWGSGDTAAGSVSGGIVSPTAVSGTGFAWTWGGPQTITVDFGTSTDVLGAHFAVLGINGSYGSNASTVQMSGMDASGSVIATSSILSIGDTYQFLNAGFIGVHSIAISSEASGRWFSIDDLIINEGFTEAPVPAPGALALLGLGLLGLGMRRRAA